MGSKWRKAKVALGVNLCLYLPKTLEESRRPDDAVSVPRPTTPVPSSSGLWLPRSFSKSSSKKTCAICLTSMKAGQGHAIFTAECSHSFHFHCITTNVKHGNQICPVCRAKWNEVPLQSPNAKSKSPVIRPRDDAWMTLPPPRRSSHNQHSSSRPERLRPPVSSIFNTEPAVFNDDEALEHRKTETEPEPESVTGKLEVKTYPEVSEVLRSVWFKDFAVLINLKAPSAASSKSASSRSRAPVDLVTVLDVSGSMAGTKLALLKRAMGFVIQNLGPFDRLSVTSFSSTARRNFPLRHMTETGKQEALKAVNSLVANGGTNIAEGLKKGSKVLTDRRFKNSVSSILLLSDGQDTYNMASSPTGHDYKTLVPKDNLMIPVHAFGFGADHDAALMHSIAENSGGTFSFIESETVIQDAFAQCIGGLLSVIVQELCVEIECVHPMLRIGSVKAGSYRFDKGADSRTGCIGVGDLYAEEERNFLVNLDVPVVNDDVSEEPMSLLKVRCVYKDQVTEETVDSCVVKILRPVVMSERKPVVSVEVERQRIRLRAAQAISEARVLAEGGDLTEAVSVLETCRGVLSAQTGDHPLCVSSLCAELKETQERMASRQVYETSGRAYVLAGLSSHSWQRATARGDMSDSTTVSYQTQSMVDMVNLSQTMNFGCPLASFKSNSSSSQKPPARRKLRQALSFPARPRPR